MELKISKKDVWFTLIISRGKISQRCMALRTWFSGFWCCFFFEETASMPQLPQCYKATVRRQFTFYHKLPRNSWYSFDRTQKDEKLSRPWNHSEVWTWDLWIWNPAPEPLGHKISFDEIFDIWACLLCWWY